MANWAERGNGACQEAGVWLVCSHREHRAWMLQSELAGAMGPCFVRKCRKEFNAHAIQKFTLEGFAGRLHWNFTPCALRLV